MGVVRLIPAPLSSPLPLGPQQARPAPGPGHPDYASTEVVREVLLGEGAGRLVQDKELAKSFGLPPAAEERTPWQSVPRSFSPTFSPIAVMAVANPTHVDDATKALYRHFQALATQPPTPDEVKAAQRRLINRYALSHREPERFATILARHEAMDIGHEADAAYLDLVRQVTPEEARRVAEKYFAHVAIGVQMPLPD